ncbi:30S ribosomal protein S18 [Candidatus Omnitrophota bacterium]
MRIGQGRGKGKGKGLLRKGKKKRGLFGPRRKKVCRFCVDKNKRIDYKDLKMLEIFTTERGKIVSCRFSGNCARHQRKVALMVKQARFMALIPYVNV